MEKKRTYCFLYQEEDFCYGYSRTSDFFDDDDPIRIQKIGTWYFYHSSATVQGFGGIGFLVSPQAFSNIDFIKSISPRILHVQLSSSDHLNQFKTNLVNVSSPTSTAPIELVEDFYTTLASTVSDIPTRQLCIPLGDFNAMLLRNNHWSSKIGNRNSEPFVDFLESNSFISGASLSGRKSIIIPLFMAQGIVVWV